MVDLADLWLAASTVQLQVSNCSQLSDYTVQLWLYRMISGKLSSKCTNHIEEIVMVMNNQLIPFWTQVLSVIRQIKVLCEQTRELTFLDYVKCYLV